MADTKAEKQKLDKAGKSIPKDAQVVMSIMKDMGITDYEPRVINQLLEFIYRYVTSVLEDARVYANHAKKKAIDLDDVRLAVQLQLDKSFTTPPPREVLLELARNKNINPLPLIKPHCGLRLPPDRYCLSGCNYRLKQAVKKPITKTLVATNKTLGSPKPGNVQLPHAIKRPASMMSSPKQAGSPKPVLKFTANSKVVAKPAIRVTAGPPQVKKEHDSIGLQ